MNSGVHTYDAQVLLKPDKALPIPACVMGEQNPEHVSVLKYLGVLFS
jgi:hypothetical protein